MLSRPFDMSPIYIMRLDKLVNLLEFGDGRPAAIQLRIATLTSCLNSTLSITFGNWRRRDASIPDGLGKLEDQERGVYMGNDRTRPLRMHSNRQWVEKSSAGPHPENQCYARWHPVVM